LTYASYNEIISLSKSLGFDTTNNADLIREYFFLTLIHSWKGKNAGSKAIYESSKFFNIWNRYQMDFFDSEQVGKTSFWETVDALLLLFQINNLYDFQNFVCKLCPWVIADWQAFESTFSHDDLSIGSKVAALALLLKYIGLSADYDNISSVDPQQFFEKMVLILFGKMQQPYQVRFFSLVGMLFLHTSYGGVFGQVKKAVRTHQRRRYQPWVMDIDTLNFKKDVDCVRLRNAI